MMKNGICKLPLSNIELIPLQEADGDHHQRASALVPIYSAKVMGQNKWSSGCLKVVAW